MTEQAQQAAAKLPEHMRMAAESAAENDSIRASQAKYFGEKAGLDRKDSMTKRANLSSKTMRLLDAVGKAAGVQVRFAETVAGGMSNASYENGVVTIALDTESPVQAVFTHEIVHRIREVSPESYGQLAQFVTSNMHQMKLRFAQASYGARYEASGDLVTEEIVADAIGFVLSDSKMVNKLVQENRSLAQRIADGIHDFVAAINRVLEGQNVKLTSSQKFTFRELEGQLDEMGKLLGNALKTVEKTGSQAYNVSNETKFSRKESQYGREENRGNEEAGRETEHDARGEGTVQRAVRRVHGKEDGMVRHSQKGERPVISWKPGEIITPANGTVAYDEAQTAESYNVSCFVIQDAAWDAYWAGAKKIPPAFTKGGQVYLRATIPSDVRGMVAPHELTHVMKQTGYQPYLDFINRTLNHLNQKSAYTQQMLTDIADQRGIVLKPKMDRNDIVDWYDEFHANIYGEIAANTTDDVRWLLDQVFLDFDAYAAELTELHRQFKASRTGAKNSLKDSEGRTLTKEQQEFFKDSKIRDENGRLQVMYHGTMNGGFNVFGVGGAYYFTNDVKYANTFAGRRSDGSLYERVRNNDIVRSEVYKVYLDAQNPYVYEENEDNHIIDGVDFWDIGSRSANEKIYAAAKAHGYDALVFSDLSQVVVFSPEQIKRVDNKKPTTDQDIRYSLKDSEGRKLSEEQQAFFAHSKVRDAEGRLTPVYHGTPNGGFTEFKLPQHLSTLMAARGAGYYFTDKKNARQYMKPVNKTGVATNKQLYEVYLNITNPLVIAHNSPVSITKEQFKEIVRRGN